jgi:hypothetical protein
MDAQQLGRLVFSATLGLTVWAGADPGFAQPIIGIDGAALQSYFDVATSFRKSDSGYGGPGHSGGDGDALLRVTNVGNYEANADGFLCANIYVIGDDQQLQECCSCPVSPDGLLTVSVTNDLISNPLISNTSLSNGSIKVIGSSQDNSACINGFTAGTLRPGDLSSGLRAWINHTETMASNQAPDFKFITSTSSLELRPVAIDDGEGSTVIATECFFAQFFGSGAGICSCGVGS